MNTIRTGPPRYLYARPIPDIRSVSRRYQMRCGLARLVSTGIYGVTEVIL